MPLNIDLQHSRMIYLQVYEPFQLVLRSKDIHTDRSVGRPTWENTSEATSIHHVL